MNHLTIAPLLLPLLAGTILLLLRSYDTPVRRGLSVLASLALVGISIALALHVAEHGVQVYQLGNWAAPFGIVLVADQLAVIMVLITSVLAACVVLYAVRGSDHAGRYFHILFQMQIFGLNGAFLTGDLFNLFVFFEVLLIASYGLLLHGGGRKRTRAGLHYVVLNLIGSTLFLFAVGTLYGVLGTLNMADLAQRMSSVPAEDLGVVRAAGLLLFAVFALKAALAPLHLWLPGAYGQTSAPVAAMFAIMTKVGAYAILRIHSLMFGPEAGPLAGLLDAWLLPLALITVVAGTIGVLASRRLAEQAAYLVIISAGSLLTAFGLGGADAFAAGLYYLVHSTFAAAALFLLAGILGEARGSIGDRLIPGPELPRGQLLGGLFLLIALTTSGMPPLSGFIGKWLILQASLGTPDMSWVLAVLLVTSLLTIMALARSGTRMFFSIDELAIAASPARSGDLIAPVALATIGIAMVVYAGPLYDFAHMTATQLVQPEGYLAAVLKSTVLGGAQ